jgi:arginyl-tRNA synthetase
MLRELVRARLQEAIQRLYGISDQIPSGLITVPEKPEFGDLSSTVAFHLAQTKSGQGEQPRRSLAPRQIAEEIVAAIDKSPFERVEIAGPGFINFFFKPETIHQALREILAQESEYGKLSVGRGKRAQVEFVSANPTGPLTVGHCRQAVLGDVISRLLENAGYDVTREYYYNDAGRQMKLLGESVRARYVELLGKPSNFPKMAITGSISTRSPGRSSNNTAISGRAPASSSSPNLPRGSSLRRSSVRSVGSSAGHLSASSTSTTTRAGCMTYPTSPLPLQARGISRG